MCCKLLGIPELKKQPNVWCSKCKVGKGCGIYPDRPESCRNFECIWLQSQSKMEGGLPSELRPDRCKVVFAGSTRPDLVSVHVDPGKPLAWQEPAIQHMIKVLAMDGYKVIVGHGGTPKKKLFVRQGEHVFSRTIMMSPPDENGMQWASNMDLDSPLQSISNSP
jgi:hypothetical protein